MVKECHEEEAKARKRQTGREEKHGSPHKFSRSKTLRRDAPAHSAAHLVQLRVAAEPVQHRLNLVRKTLAVVAAQPLQQGPSSIAKLRKGVLQQRHSMAAARHKSVACPGLIASGASLGGDAWGYLGPGLKTRRLCVERGIGRAPPLGTRRGRPVLVSQRTEDRPEKRRVLAHVERILAHSRRGRGHVPLLLLILPHLGLLSEDGGKVNPMRDKEKAR